MGILSIYTDFAGEVSVHPRRVRIITTDNLTTVSTAGYLNVNSLQGYVIYPTDFVDMVYSYSRSTNSGSNGTFLVSVSNGVITLTIDVAGGTANHIACFSGALGTLIQDPATAIQDGNLQLGSEGSQGYLQLYPVTAARGSLRIAATDNTGDTLLTVSNVPMGQATVLSFTDPGAAAGYVNPSNVNATGTVLSCLIWKDILIQHTQLAAAAHVILQPSSGTMRFQVRNIIFNATTGLSGGGGNRLLHITDGTTVWNNAGITKALLETPENTPWGGTGNPMPATSTATSQVSQPGVSIYAVYTGGTTDYTAGEVGLTLLFERIE